MSGVSEAPPRSFSANSTKKKYRMPESTIQYFQTTRLIAGGVRGLPTLFASRPTRQNRNTARRRAPNSTLELPSYLSEVSQIPPRWFSANSTKQKYRIQESTIQYSRATRLLVGSVPNPHASSQSTQHNTNTEYWRVPDSTSKLPG